MSFDLFKGIDIPSVVALAAAGAAGGFYRWIILRPKLVDGLITVGSGTIAAIIFGPILSPMIVAAGAHMTIIGPVEVTHDQALPAGGFLAGLLGISAAGFAIDFARALGRVLLNRAKNGGAP